jgi:hypothetical protein
VISVSGREYGVLESLHTLLETHVRYGILNLWVDSICIYSHRTTMKHCRNLRFMPQLSEGFDFVSKRKNSCSVILR